MKLKVVGVEKSAGEFTPQNAIESIKFNNYNLYGLDFDNSRMLAGNKAVKVKMKISEYEAACRDYPDPAALLNKTINVYYNQFGKLELIEIVK